MQIGILEKKDFSVEAIKNLKKIGKVSFFNDKNLDIFLKDKDIIFIRLKYFIGKDFLNLAKKLKVICTPTTGLNHLDLKEIEKRNIKIVSLKGEYKFLSEIRATPEHAFGLTLSLLKNYNKAFLNGANNDWNRDVLKGFEIFKKNVGIIGFGRVGKILSKYFLSFGASVYFYDVNKKIKDQGGARSVNSLNNLIKKSDIVLLCVDYSEKNDKFFNKKYIDLLKNKYFINIARGELIDENYLLKKIRDNYFKGIALDVIANENGRNNLNKFLKLTKNRNFILTPHIGGATYESMHKTENFITIKLENVFE